VLVSDWPGLCRDGQSKSDFRLSVDNFFSARSSTPNIWGISNFFVATNSNSCTTSLCDEIRFDTRVCSWHTVRMADIVQIPSTSERKSSAPANSRAESIVSTIKVLFSEIPVAEQERVLTDLTEILRPIPAPRAGDVLGALIHLLPKRAGWTVQELKQAIGEHGIAASPKEIYNALGYLTRKRKIQRTGYGRYAVEGMQVVTSDDLGGPPSRHEIDDT